MSVMPLLADATPEEIATAILTTMQQSEVFTPAALLCEEVDVAAAEYWQRSLADA